jgi:hypothetical protein
MEAKNATTPILLRISRSLRWRLPIVKGIYRQEVPHFSLRLASSSNPGEHMRVPHVISAHPVARGHAVYH